MTENGEGGWAQTIPWLYEMRFFKNDLPMERGPYVRTVHINDKRDGCYICGRKTTLTRHHVRRMPPLVAVYICWKHHQILHGVALSKKYTKGRRRRRGKYISSDADLRACLSIGKEYNLFKNGEAGMVTKRITLELQRRDNERAKIEEGNI